MATEQRADGKTIIHLTGWSSSTLDDLRRRLDNDEWSPLVRVSVAATPTIAIAARYAVTDNGVDVIPQFGLDAGRDYLVHIEADSPSTASSPITLPFRLPETAASESTSVTAIFPSADVWPENILRFYLHFSAPMSGTSAIDYVRLVDDRGNEIEDALLEVDVDLWNADYTRRTVFFDPGRVKQGIRPNVELGRALVAGRQYAIVVSREWRDSQDQRLTAEFRHPFTAGPPIESGIDPAAWAVEAPSSGSRAPLIVRFSRALDEGLLHRAIGVIDAGGRELPGEVVVGPAETSWQFVPEQPWTSDAHAIVVLTLLEDPSGNTVGQPFEFEMFERPASPRPERLTLAFRPR